MPQGSWRLRILIILGGCLGLAAGLKIVAENLRTEPLWAAGGAVFLIAALASAWGLWLGKRWGLWLSFFLAAAAFATGIYAVYFYWTFWIFKQPTLEERIAALLRPEVFFFLGVPTIWFSVFLQREVRKRFCK